jgi:hypothetical protein
MLTHEVEFDTKTLKNKPFCDVMRREFGDFNKIAVQFSVTKWRSFLESPRHYTHEAKEILVHSVYATNTETEDYVEYEDPQDALSENGYKNIMALCFDECSDNPSVVVEFVEEAHNRNQPDRYEEA